MIAIVDYGMGNLRSVLNAFHYIGQDTGIVNNPDLLKKADAVVLPGVGSFGDGISNLRKSGFVEALEEEVLRKSKPFLGICLGMQLLATTGFEYGEFAGLNWIQGVVDKIPVSGQDNNLRIPHIGWNEVHVIKKDGLYNGLGDSQVFYFVHSYVLIPKDASLVSGTFSYGSEFTASIEFNNICATQFHPEKSHHAGLGLIRNWCLKFSYA